MQTKTYLSLLMIVLFSWVAISVSAQGGDADPPKNWFHMDNSADGYRGVSTDRLYAEFLKQRESKTVIVAVIDSGVDSDHEDLKGVMWVNPGEIAGNGLDDDRNGYIDDIHGWNFIGGPDGNVESDNLELTRLYRKEHAKYGNLASDANMSKKEKKAYAYYLELKGHYDKNRAKAKSSLDRYTGIKEQATASIKAVKTALGKKKLNMKNIEALEPGANEELSIGKQAVMRALTDNPKITFKGLKEQVAAPLEGAINYFSNQLNAYYNADFDPRSVVGDDYSNQYERYYGNNDYEGNDASHGTHVAGIIGAERNNGVGMDGVANNVRIMTIRAVPDGDERDKDVANAIRYAVDNGASVINMSFGKGFSWNKKVVDEAVKHAYKNDVLLVHAAGNDGKSNDITDNFPVDSYEKPGFFGPKTAKNWVEVGALNFAQGDKSAASFSNYGKKQIDLFAPGVKIYSTIPNDEYASFNGTSMASPVVAGVAALLRSYFPDLTAVQVKKILMDSSVPIMDKVQTPGDAAKLTPFANLSVSGGTVNAYSAVKMAEKTKGKKKMKKGSSSTKSGSMKSSTAKKGRA